MHNKIYLSDLCQVWSLVALCAFIMCIHYVHSCCAATTITGLQNFFIVWNWHFVPLNNNFLRNFLMVQWLGYSAFTPGGLGLIPCQGTKISQVMSCGMAKKVGFVLSLFFFFFFDVGSLRLFLICEWECNVFLLQKCCWEHVPKKCQSWSWKPPT